MTDSDDFVRRLPKAELHVHIEGTLEPELVFELAARNKVHLDYPDVAALRQGLVFDDLQSFLDIYYAQLRRDAHGAGFLRPDDGLPVPRRRAQGVRHAEIFFDPRRTPGAASPFETLLYGGVPSGPRRRHGDVR